MLSGAVTGQFNPCRQEVACFDELVAAALARYGPCSQGLGYIRYEQLMFLRRRLLAAPGSPVLAARVAAVRDALNEQYRDSAGELPDHPTTVVSEDPLVIEFSRSAFHGYGYAAVAAEVMAATVELGTAGSAGRLRDGPTYLYVIDEVGRVLVWLRQFHFADLVFGRDRARVGGVPVAHPMLVPDTLRARAAGEAVFLGEGEVGAVIANTKSGHFQPPSSVAAVVRSRFATALGLSERDVDVIVVT